MKKWDELTEEQQSEAKYYVLGVLLRDITQEGMRLIDDSADEAVIKAIEKAEKMQTPWFAHEYVMDAEYVDEDGNDRKLSDLLHQIARSTAMDALYSESDEYVIHGIA
jgi:hypothetical protein